MAVISSGGYYTDYTGAQVDSAVGIALTLSNYQTLKGVSSVGGNVYLSGATLTTPAQVVDIVSNGGYATSGAVVDMIDSAIASGGAAGVPTTINGASGNLILATADGLTLSTTTSGGSTTFTLYGATSGGEVTSGAVLSIVSSAGYTTSGAVVQLVSTIANTMTTVSAYSVSPDSAASASLTAGASNQFLLEFWIPRGSAGGVTSLTTVIDSTNTTATIPTLAGGTAYVYTQPLTSLGIQSITSTTAEDTIIFTAGSPSCQLNIPANVGLVEGGVVSGGVYNIQTGSSYIIGATQQTLVIVNYGLTQ